MSVFQIPYKQLQAGFIWKISWKVTRERHAKVNNSTHTYKRFKSFIPSSAMRKVLTEVEQMQKPFDKVNDSQHSTTISFSAPHTPFWLIHKFSDFYANHKRFFQRKG